MTEETCHSARKLRRKRLGLLISACHKWRHRLEILRSKTPAKTKGYQQCIRTRYLDKTCLSVASHQEFWFLCFREIFQRITSIEGILYLPNEVSCLWSLKPPDPKGDTFACNSNMQVLQHYQDPCQSLAESEANDGNAEKKDPARTFCDRGRVIGACKMWPLRHSHWRQWGTAEDCEGLWQYGGCTEQSRVCKLL